MNSATTQAPHVVKLLHQIMTLCRALLEANTIKQAKNKSKDGRSMRKNFLSFLVAAFKTVKDNFGEETNSIMYEAGCKRISSWLGIDDLIRVVPSIYEICINQKLTEVLIQDDVVSPFSSQSRTTPGTSDISVTDADGSEAQDGEQPYPVLFKWDADGTTVILGFPTVTWQSNVLF